MTSLWTRLTGGGTAGRGGMGIRVGAFGGFTPSQRCDMSPGPQAVLFFVSLFLLVPCAEFFAISASPEVSCPFSASTDVGLQLIRSSDFSVESFSLFLLSMLRNVKVDKMKTLLISVLCILKEDLTFKYVVLCWCVFPFCCIY